MSRGSGRCFPAQLCSLAQLGSRSGHSALSRVKFTEAHRVGETFAYVLQRLHRRERAAETLLQATLHLAARLHQLVVHPCALTSRLHHARGAHDTEVSRDLRLRLSKRLRQHAHAGFVPRGQEHGQLQTRRITQDSEQRGFPFRGYLLSGLSYSYMHKHRYTDRLSLTCQVAVAGVAVTRLTESMAPRDTEGPLLRGAGDRPPLAPSSAPERPEGQLHRATPSVTRSSDPRHAPSLLRSHAVTPLARTAGSCL